MNTQRAADAIRHTETGTEVARLRARVAELEAALEATPPPDAPPLPAGEPSFLDGVSAGAWWATWLVERHDTKTGAVELVEPDFMSHPSQDYRRRSAARKAELVVEWVERLEEG